jgi:hypothetical protein
MPLECYERDAGPGYTIANKYDISQLKLVPIEVGDILQNTYSVGYNYDRRGLDLYGYAENANIIDTT